MTILRNNLQWATKRKMTIFLFISKDVLSQWPLTAVELADLQIKEQEKQRVLFASKFLPGPNTQIIQTLPVRF